MRLNFTLYSLLLFSLTILQSYAQEDTTKTKEEFKYFFNSKKDTSSISKTPEIYDTLSLSDFYDMSLEELEDIKATGVSSDLEKFINSLISVSTQKSLPIRYSPNIVSLVTEEEIQTMGARDLIDVLNQVPGFHFGQDTKGNVGLGIRGNWAAEGKVLVMINGMEINEHYTAHTYFGSHFPVNMIKRIEIIRGPGSSIHGGYAEFGVINIVTKAPKDLSGLEVGIDQGFGSKGGNRNKINFYVGKEWKKSNLNFWLSSDFANRSYRDHYGFYNCNLDSLSCTNNLGVGKYRSLADNSEINSVMMNLTFNWGGFSITNLSDIYGVTDVTSLDHNDQSPFKYGYFGNYTELKYKFRITPKLTITPKLNFNIQTPWEENTPYANALQNNPDRADSLAIATSRIRARLDINYDISHRVNLLIGINTFTDYAINADTVSAYYKGSPPETYSSTALYAEATFKLPIFHLFAGLRYENNASYSYAFSPRIGITKKFNKFHAKFLVTDAYRLPTLGNLYYSFNGNYQIAPDSSYMYDLERGLKPEKTLVLELEAGYQFSEKVFVTANIFDMTMRDPIVYYYYQDETVRDIYGTQAGFYVYQNYEKSGTRGFELDFRFQDKWGYLNANYSFYSVENKPRVDAYSVSTFNRDPSLRDEVKDNLLLAFPQHKFNINWLYKITPDFSVNLTNSLLSTRYGYDIEISGPDPSDTDGVLKKYRTSFVMNFYFRYQNLFTPGLTAGVGVNDIFNQGALYIQPYFGGLPPLPGSSREVNFKVSYTLPFGKNKNKNR